MIELRPLLRDDNVLLVRYLNNPNVVEHLSAKIPQPYTLDDANWWLESGSQDNAINRAITVNGEFCGVIGAYLQAFNYAHSAEIGYWLAPAYWYNGIATQAVIEFSQFLFSTTELTRLYNPVSAPNIASIKVMQKAGYQLEGIMQCAFQKNGQFYDEHLYAKVRC